MKIENSQTERSSIELRRVRGGSTLVVDDLSRLVRVVRLSVYVAATADFTRQSIVANGAFNLLVNVLGEKGRHARTAVGVTSLASGVAVEVDAVFELAP